MRKSLKFIPIQITFSLIVGIVTGYFIPIKTGTLQLFLILLLSVLIIVFVFSKRFLQKWFVVPLITYVSFIFIGIAAITFQNQLNWKGHFSKKNQFTLSKPIIAEITIAKELKPTAYALKYEAEVKTIANLQSKGKVLLLIEGDSLQHKFQVGNTYIVQGTFDTILNLNPFGFDYKKYLKNHQIFHQLIVSNQTFTQLKGNDKSLQSLAAAIRLKVISALLKEGFKNDVLAVMNALILGQRSDISDDLLKSYAGAGAMHILAVSGLHIGIILLLLLAIFKPLYSIKKGKIMAGILIVLLLWCYAIIVGLSPSVVRAVTMFSAVTVGLLLNKHSIVYNTLVISVFFLLLFNPFYLFEIGFQLSYTAVFFIVWLQPKFYNLWQPKSWLIKKIWQLITVSLAAQIGVLPLSLYYFHQFPSLFFITNLLIIPFLGLVIIIGIVVISLSILQLEPHFLTTAYIFIIEKMNMVVILIANQEAFLFKNIRFSLALVVGSYLFIILLFKWIEYNTYRRFMSVMLALIVIQMVFIFEKYSIQIQNQFIVFNTYRNTLLGFRNGSKLQLSTTIKSDKTTINYINQYLIEAHLKNVEIDTFIPNIINYKESKILVIDHNGIFNIPQLKPELILLRNSPKINFERMLNLLKPKMIIADASNYKSYVNLWKNSAKKNSIKFINTAKFGAFILNR